MNARSSPTCAWPPPGTATIPELTALITDLTARSPRFAELWEKFEVGPRVSAHKTVQHPDVGPIALDCEVLAVAGSDLKMIVCTAEPNTADAANLELLRRPRRPAPRRLMGVSESP